MGSGEEGLERRDPTPDELSGRRLLLVGGGHAHLELLRRLILHPRDDVALTLVSTGPRQYYSGMVPGYLARLYREEEISFDVEALAGRARGAFVKGRAAGVDPLRREVRMEDGGVLGFDLVSFAVGSTTKGADRAGGHARFVKPIEKAVELRASLERLAATPGDAPARVVIVGAGAAGFEVACAARALLDASRRRASVTIVDAAPRILGEYAPRVARLGEEILKRKGISFLLGRRAARVDPDGVSLEDGERLPADLTVWLAGTEALELFQGSSLALDQRGFLLVDDALRSISNPHVFAAGDCATLARHPETPKAGVYAVREGPLLWKSILAALDDSPPPAYRPQRSFLSILNTCDGRALLRYGGVVSWSRPASVLKDAIDRRFMRKYQRLAESG